MLTDLNEDNFVLFAMHCYDNPQCRSTEEFENDLKRFGYLRKLFNRYEYGELKHRLILNHIIILANVFGIENTVKMLYFKISEKHHNTLRTFLVYLRYQYDTDYETPYDPIVLEGLAKDDS